MTDLMDKVWRVWKEETCQSLLEVKGSRAKEAVDSDVWRLREQKQPVT